jgi:hypothetical protein
MKIEEFLAKCEAAGEVPVVYSEPLGYGGNCRT